MQRYLRSGLYTPVSALVLQKKFKFFNLAFSLLSPSLTFSLSQVNTAMGLTSLLGRLTSGAPSMVSRTS